mmetsp:Transcript_954/g.2058  ORF Transcript_954/g.2058 Transcript_954/m.2058 type:complete len:379 (+) Transcript_954:76-1212(+)
MIATHKPGGFIIPQRTMTQMFFSAANGLVSLFSEKTRVGFMDSLEKGIIQEGVLSQATAGPLVMLSLFHDLQNPLFKKHKFDPTQFMDGLVPALENFHNVSSALENQFHELNQRVISNSETEGAEQQTREADTDFSETTNEVGALAKEEKESLMSVLQTMAEDDEFDSQQKKIAEAILNHEWMDEARNHPDSLAAQLSRMVTKELFQINQLSSKTAFLLQNQSRNIHFREGSCRVNNVALLSARACLFREKEGSSSDGEKDEKTTTEYKAIDPNLENDFCESETAVAAQLEVLYDVTQEFVIKNSAKFGSKETKMSNDTSPITPSNSTSEQATQTTIVSVATIEGWLHRGPDDGQLRWKLASYRPPYEFPGIEHAYNY